MFDIGMAGRTNDIEKIPLLRDIFFALLQLSLLELELRYITTLVNMHIRLSMYLGDVA